MANKEEEEEKRTRAAELLRRGRELEQMVAKTSAAVDALRSEAHSSEERATALKAFSLAAVERHAWFSSNRVGLLDAIEDLLAIGRDP